MQNETNLRNLIIAFVAIIAIMGAWQIFIWGPQDKAAQKAFAENQAKKAEIEKVLNKDKQTDLADALTDTKVKAPVVPDVRVPFDGDAMDGTILLRGARVDQLKLKDYYDTLEDKEAKNPNGEVKIFEPENSKNGFYATYGWRKAGAEAITKLSSNWELIEGSELTPTTPITLGFTGGGLEVRRVISMDEHYMFTYSDTVKNVSGQEMTVQPFGVLMQNGVPTDLANFYILHEGLVAATGKKLHLEKYKKLGQGKVEFEQTSNEGGYIGFTDKYWLGAIIPAQDKPFTVKYQTLNRDTGQILQARMDGPESVLAPGETATSVNRIFGGAKESALLQTYQKELSIPRFVDAIDWGSMFFWLTKPFFAVLTFINGYVGNFGVSILILTVIVKALFFPIQNKAYQSMAKMREMAEPMKKIRETVSDKAEQQKAIAKLYQEHKINPVSGCLPIFFQMPVFYGLYKTLFVTIEMRHEPFFGWIRDLSAPDPSAIGNLFGLLPISTASLESVPFIGVTVLTIGILPIIYGITMWALQSLNPPPTDETQKLIFGFLPIIFTFIFAGFAAGLVIYWCWSNILSIAQQYAIMRQNGVKTQLDKFIDSKFGKNKGEAQN